MDALVFATSPVRAELDHPERERDHEDDRGRTSIDHWKWPLASTTTRAKITIKMHDDFGEGCLELAEHLIPGGTIKRLTGGLAAASAFGLPRRRFLHVLLPVVNIPSRNTSSTWQPAQSRSVWADASARPAGLAARATP